MYKIRCVAKPLKITNNILYDNIKEIDLKLFPTMKNDEFNKENVYWWAAICDNIAVGYSGLRIIKDTGFFCRAGVLLRHRKNKLHKKMISARIKMAKKLNLSCVITYTVNNIVSSNNLINRGFRLYEPEWKWAGINGVTYFKLQL